MITYTSTVIIVDSTIQGPAGDLPERLLEGGHGALHPGDPHAPGRQVYYTCYYALYYRFTQLYMYAIPLHLHYTIHTIDVYHTLYRIIILYVIL